MSRARAVIAVLLIVGTGALAQAARRQGPQLHSQLEALPLQLNAWRGRDAGPFDEETVRVLGADAYLNRSYQSESGAPVDLYIAYYGRQKPGASIHSPLHCLPGTGWEPLDIATVPIEQSGGGGEARRLVVTKNLERAVVFYWYAVHGRTIANEVVSKAWLLHDSLWLHRSDAALVRIVVPVRGVDIDAAQREGLAFAHDVLPYLPKLWS
jgi:EpsI family protein